jgi:hypothetical protein
MILSENFATFRKLCTGGAAPLARDRFATLIMALSDRRSLSCRTWRLVCDFGQCQFNPAYFKALNLLEVLEFEHVLIEKGDQRCWDMLQGRGSVAVVLGVGWRHQAFETPQKVFLGHPVELHIAQGIGCHALGR